MAVNAPTPRVPETRLAALVFVLFVALALIAAAELDPNGPRQGWGLYGYFLLQAGGWLGLRDRHPRPSGILGAFVVFNLVLFVLLDIGLLGPQLDLIAGNLVLIFFTGIAGAVGLLYAIALVITDLRGGPPRNAAGTLIGLLVIVVAAGSAFVALSGPARSLLAK